MAAPWATYPRHSSLSCAILPWHVKGAARRDAQRGAQALGVQSWGVTKAGPGSAVAPQPRDEQAVRGLCEICCLSELPSSFLNSRYRACVMGEGNPSLGVSFTPCQLWTQKHKRTKPKPGLCGTTPGLQVGSVTISDHGSGQCRKPNQHQAGKVWLQRMLHLKNSALLICPQTRICAFDVTSPKRNGVKTKPHFKTHPFF